MGNTNSSRPSADAGGAATVAHRPGETSRPGLSSSATRSCRVQHIEVIGGGHGHGHGLSPLPHPARVRTRTRTHSLGLTVKPRLPIELRRHIYGMTVAMLLRTTEDHTDENHTQGSTATSGSRSDIILDVALVERSARTEVLSALLSELTLSGMSQMRSFTRFLTRYSARAASPNGFGPYERRGGSGESLHLARTCVRTLRLLQNRSPFCVSVRAQASKTSLYDNVGATRAFERSLLHEDTLPLHLLFAADDARGAALETLVLQGPPSVLCEVKGTAPAHQTRQRVLVQLRANLKELVCMLSLWGNGDAFEGLWEMASVRPPAPFQSLPSAWSRLTHLQLHGPRMRFTTRTAHSLGDLPALTHLAIILPRFFPVDATADQPSWTQQHFSGSTIEQAEIEAEVKRSRRHGHLLLRDAAGRSTVLQVLVNVCARLRELQLIGHEESEYAGHVGSLPGQAAALRLGSLRGPGPMHNSLDRSDGETIGNQERAQPLRVHVITLRRSSYLAARQATQTHGCVVERTHPTWYSHYLYALSCVDRHWQLPHRADRRQNGIGREADACVDANWGVCSAVETFVVPVVKDGSGGAVPSQWGASAGGASVYALAGGDAATESATSNESAAPIADLAGDHSGFLLDEQDAGAEAEADTGIN
ncbi:hypothetical protein K437DRAFT_271906 [Tilletiaria anomala UBC 951]|uniref:Uncharacterized protein n=1 Tax=Tilletiaria anomala (strain ATCC 24038 / CBS 436.72 / UBC 951) TaxID=1037660 RepID=A0A066WH20_TILAU|nr:uncharacterized protein K437DRAFT_271906 [Tilletiaria anomala UBC 951]KDN53121.1 hypothetical protein K437DRAFT_271906 [Tilletiaria anomala UBC 951]